MSIADRLRDKERRGSPDTRGLRVVAVAFLTPLLIIGGYYLFQFSASAGAQIRESAERNRISRAESEQVEMGWSHKQVAELLGRPGEEVSVSEMDLPYVGSVTTVGRIWRNKDGSSLQLVFQNDKVVFKNQLLLKP